MYEKGSKTVRMHNVCLPRKFATNEYLQYTTTHSLYIDIIFKIGSLSTAGLLKEHLCVSTLILFYK